MEHFGLNHYSNSETKEYAKKLRWTMTPAEHRFWFLVRNRKFLGLKFRRQHPLGRYIVDFYCHELSLVIELDGGIHHLKKNRNYDALREKRLVDMGMIVLRFRNEDVFSQLDKVEGEVRKVIELRRS